MKRFTTLSLFLVVLLMSALAPVVAWAGSKPVTVDVAWEQQRAAFLGGFADSVSTRALGSASPTAHDTSAWISLQDFVMPDKGAGQLPTASDSLSWLRVDFFPSTSAPTVAADTIYMTIQVIGPGVNSAISCTPTTIFDTTTDSGNGAIVLEQATSNAFFYVLRQRVGAVASGDLFFPLRSSSTAPTFQQIYGWPMMRLIVQSDHTGRYDAKLSGFVAQ